MSIMDLVREFHAKMNQTIGDTSSPNVSHTKDLRLSLISEELEELEDALAGWGKNPGERIEGEDQIIAVADALGDLMYVIAGAAITWGIPLDAVVRAIHESNMTKTADNRRADGKILKGPNYVPPDIRGAIWPK